MEAIHSQIIIFLLTLFSSWTSGTIYLIGGNEGITNIETLNEDSLSDDNVGSLPDFPIPASMSIGAYFNGEILICGGFTYPFIFFKDCYALSGNGTTWEARPPLNYFRRGAASVLIDENRLWVTGGESSTGCVATTEFLVANNSKWIPGPDLPECLVEHCMVKLDNNTILITGGRQITSHPFSSQRTWLFRVNESKFEELDSGLLFDKRIGASCAPIVLNNGTRVVAIVGGKSSESSIQQTSFKLSQMEIFNPETKMWTLLNQPIPVLSNHIAWGATLVPSSKYGLLLIGGTTPFSGVLNTIFQYHEKFGFRLLARHLGKPRFGHVAINTEQIDAGVSVSSEKGENLTTIPDILIVGGRGPNPTSEVEVLTFKGESQKTSDRSNFPNYPVEITGAAAGWYNDAPLVCGGLIQSSYDHTKLCYVIKDGHWAQGPTMTIGRYRARAIFDSQDFWILGGEDSQGYLDSTEILDFQSNKWIGIGFEMPRSFSRHCTVKINATHVLIAGGKQWENDIQNELRSRHVWMAHWLKGDWIEMAPMNVPRYDHSCGLFTLKNGTQIIVAAGGRTGTSEVSLIRHVEWYNIETNSWTLTSQTLNGHPEIGFYGASMIESAPHLIMMGGTDGLNYYDNVYAYNEEFGFYDTGVKLSSPKSEMAVVALQQNDNIPTSTIP